MTVENAFTAIMGGQKPYIAEEYAAREVAIARFDDAPITLRAGDYASYYVNITYRQDRFAWNAISDIQARCDHVMKTARDYIGRAPQHEPGIRKAYDEWCARHVRESLSYMARHQSMASPMVTGSGNFPVHRERKRQARADAHYDRLTKHAQAMAKRLKRLAFPYGDPREAIQSHHPEAVDLLRRKKAHIEAQQAKRKAINAIWRKAGKPGKQSTDDDWRVFSDAMRAAGHAELTEAIRRGCVNHYMADRVAVPPFAGFELSNPNAEIRRLAQRIKTLETVSTVKADETVETNAGPVRIERDGDAYRIRLFFDGKPDAATRAVVKSHGFRWAPSVGAWQRHLNRAGEDAVARVIKAIGGQS